MWDGSLGRRCRIDTMGDGPVHRWIIQSARRASVVAAAALLILGYLFLLNAFGELYGAGQGWNNPLLWLACALSALVVLVAVCWILTRFVWWISGRNSINQKRE